MTRLNLVQIARRISKPTTLSKPSLAYQKRYITAMATESQPSAVSQAAESTTPTEQTLPKLTPSEFRQYNSMADHMDMFHNNFRSVWKTLYGAATANKRPSSISPRQFLSMGIDLCHHLEMHHTIEERHIFPVLAKKMPRFRKANTEFGELLRQHQQIHAGLVKLQAWLEQCRDGEREIRYGELKELMDGFGTVLWTHLDEEVEELGAENMRKYWTLEEMRRMPM